MLSSVLHPASAYAYVLHHMRKSIPYTQQEVCKTCNFTLYRYRQLEHGYCLPTFNEWNAILHLYQISQHQANQYVLTAQLIQKKSCNSFCDS